VSLNDENCSNYNNFYVSPASSNKDPASLTFDNFFESLNRANPADVSNKNNIKS